jgi:hypothetical protein
LDGESGDVSVAEFQNVIDEWVLVREKIDEIEASVKPYQEKRRELEQRIIQYMDACELSSFQGKLGGVEKRIVDYCNQPSEENRQIFLDHLIANGELSDVVTFHQGRLTSWYKSKKEELGFDFKAPGLDEMKQRTELRKKR